MTPSEIVRTYDYLTAHEAFEAYEKEKLKWIDVANALGEVIANNFVKWIYRNVK